MSTNRFPAPSPRPAVADPALTRPDWVGNSPRDPGRLWLDKNENSDPVLNELVRSVIASVGADAGFSYPDFGPLYRKLGKVVGIDPSHLLLTAGSDGAIRAVFEAYVQPGDTVLHTVPTFAMYSVYCRIYGARAVGIAYAASDNGPDLSAQTIIAAIRTEQPRLVCLPNPDSPTGSVFGQSDIRRIIEAAGDVGALILIDEAYYPFHADTVLPWVTQYGHLVVCRSTGKAWGMAGVRVGYAAASCPVALLLHKVRAMYEIGALSAAVFDRMLDHEPEMRRSVERLQAGKAAFLGAMRTLGLRTLSGQGNFLHVAFGRHAEAVHAGLSDLVYYRKDFAEPCLAGFSRFSATTEERFAPVIARIRAIVGEHG